MKRGSRCDGITTPGNVDNERTRETLCDVEEGKSKTTGSCRTWSTLHQPVSKKNKKRFGPGRQGRAEGVKERSRLRFQRLSASVPASGSSRTH